MKKPYKKDKNTNIKKGPKNPQNKTLRGNISINSRGIGYVRTKEYKDDIEVDHANLATALHGDIVTISLSGNGREHKGKVVEIIHRAKAGFAGVLELKNNIYYLKADDTRLYTNIIIPKNSLGEAKVGEKVFVIIENWKSSKDEPVGKIEKILGKQYDHNAEMEGIALERGFDESFPRDVVAESKSLHEIGIPADEFKNRRDMRKIPTFTIDPEDAKDFDDALSVNVLPDGNFEIGIHIADVSHYVRVGTALDREAFRRGTSVYMVDRTIPMLPEVLSNDLCSLKPDVDRLTMSAIFIIDKNAEIKSEWFGRTIIHSAKRFTYENAQKVLDDKNGPNLAELEILQNLGRKLKKKRDNEGALEFDQDEVKFVLDANGVPLRVMKKVRIETMKLIEEWMLLANRRVAEYITRDVKNKDRIFLYRIHDLPNREKIENLAQFVKTLGYDLHLENGKISSKELSKLLETLEGKPEKGLIQTSIIRSMAKAIYSTKNIGHYGLAFTFYTHFTSPIRRYPDIAVHRLLADYLAGKTISKERAHDFSHIAEYASDREKGASDAERASIKYKQVEYMAKRLGETINAVITGVTEWGMYAEEIDTKCEGMIPLRSIKGDFYKLDKKTLSLVGEKTKKRFRVGDPVTVKVMSSDIVRKTIDYELVS